MQGPIGSDIDDNPLRTKTEMRKIARKQRQRESMREALYNMKDLPPGAISPLLFDDGFGNFRLDFAITLKEKGFKKIKKRASAGDVLPDIYFDELSPPDSSVVVVLVLIKIPGVKETFRGCLDIAEFVRSSHLHSVLESLDTRGMAILLVSQSGKSFSFNAALSPSANKHRSKVVYNAVASYEKHPWTEDEFNQVYSEVVSLLDRHGIKTINDHIMAREASLEADDDEYEA